MKKRTEEAAVQMGNNALIASIIKTVLYWLH